jgi:hypothetical protein
MDNDQAPAIRLEPRLIFDKAIVGYTNDNWAVYDYDKLIPAVRRAHGIKSKRDAMEFIDYNIGSYEGIGLRISYRHEQQ